MEKNDKKDEEGKSFFKDALGKVISVGMGGAFLSEEIIRQTLGDLKLPKDILGTLIQGAQKSKDDLTNKVSNELIKLFSKIDWVKEAAKFAETHKFRINAEIEILKRDDPKE